MNSELHITKLDAAKRQLETAIRLYFNDADPVSIHTLVGAAHEIISELKMKRGAGPMIMSDTLIKDQFKPKFREKLREAKNFFKHADKDPDSSLKFKSDINDYFLLDACEGYQILTGEKVPHFIIFRGWFCYKHPELFNKIAETSEIRIQTSVIREKFGDNKLEFYLQMLEASGLLK